MAHTRHGHHISGTTLDPDDKIVARMRCGGPKICRFCAIDASSYETSPDLRKDIQKLIEELERSIREGLVYTPQTQIDKLKNILERSK